MPARYMEKQTMARCALRVHMKRAGEDLEWSVEADRATLKLDAELVGEESLGLDDSGIAQFLRKRGLFASEGIYAIFEAIIEPEQAYRVELYDKPANAVAVVRPAR